MSIVYGILCVMLIVVIIAVAVIIEDDYIDWKMRGGDSRNPWNGDPL